MNKNHKSASWNDKLNLEDTLKIQIKTLSFSKEIHRIMIRHWLYKCFYMKDTTISLQQ